MNQPVFRQASHRDLDAIVYLLADDALGSNRERYEHPLPQSYEKAFKAIESDPHNQLIIAEIEGRMAGVIQLTLIPNITYQGGWRAQIEGVRVAARFRGQGIGQAMIEHCIEVAREAGCRLMQLTTDKQRPDAIAFYQSLGFVATHEGMKRFLG
ncbi:MAG: GNAT family N-acetyltransferase [Wenzhouxiangellaceae bacterium]